VVCWSVIAEPIAMPTELRHLLFRPAEVVQAVQEYRRRLGQALPAGRILSCGPECESSGEIVGFRLTLAADPAKGASTGEGVRQDMVIPGATLAAALILYCRDRNIPLAASAGKSLQLFGNQVCLVTTMNPGPGERAQAAAP
jgi:hypothetical protein